MEVGKTSVGSCVSPGELSLFLKVVSGWVRVELSSTSTVLCLRQSRYWCVESSRNTHPCQWADVFTAALPTKDRVAFLARTRPAAVTRAASQSLCPALLHATTAALYSTLPTGAEAVWNCMSCRSWLRTHRYSTK